jgi:hypothetical protein
MQRMVDPKTLTAPTTTNRSLNGAKRSRLPLFANPWLRGGVPVCIGILANVFAGAYIFEITRSANNITYLAWGETFNTISFWGLLLLAVAGGLFTKKLLSYESTRDNEIMKFRDENYLLAKLYETQLKADIARIEAGRHYTYSELREIVFGEKHKK